MKIKVFTYGFHPEKFLINELAEKLSDKHDVVVSTSLPNYPKGVLAEGYSFKGPYKEKIGKVKVKRFPVVLRSGGLKRLFLNYFTNLIAGTINVFRLGRGDIAFVFATSPIMTAIPAIIYGKIFRTPVVIWLQDLWPESFTAISNVRDDHIISKFLGGMVRLIYRNTDLILIQSNGFKKNLDQYGYKGKVEWLPNWAPEVAKRKEGPEWLNEFPKDKFVISFAGNIGVAQKLETLCLAAKELESSCPNLFFAIVGDGREKERLERDYSDLTNLKFFGRKPLEDMPSLFDKSDALLVMLKDDPVFSLTIPSKVQAYLQAGKPLVLSLNGEASQLVEEFGFGIHAKAEDHIELSRKIYRLVAMSREERELLGKNAILAFDQHFDSKVLIPKLEGLLKSLL